MNTIVLTGIKVILTNIIIFWRIIVLKSGKSFIISKMQFINFMIILLLVLNFAGSVSFASEDIREAIVKVYTVSNSPDYYNPWSMQGPRASSGSGCIIEDNMILTNAHVI